MSAPVVRIDRPLLVVDEVEGHPGQRRIRISYHVLTKPGDRAVGHLVHERVVLQGIELGGDPVAVAPDPIMASTDSYLVRAGDQSRRVEQLVHRVDLDVEQDWWSSGSGGETVPIAEWVDHVVAHIQLAIGDEVVAEALTPVVTGSWGALGAS